MRRQSRDGRRRLLQLAYRLTEVNGLKISERIPGLADWGHCSPIAKLPADWPGAPPNASALCWAYPVEGVAVMQKTSQLGFLSLTTSAELQFAVYGGFLLLDNSNTVVSVEAIPLDPSDAAVTSRLAFGNPRPWRAEFTQALATAERLSPVTLPALVQAGAQQFCWINPSETLHCDAEEWTPSKTGALAPVWAA